MQVQAQNRCQQAGLGPTTRGESRIGECWYKLASAVCLVACSSGLQVILQNVFRSKEQRRIRAKGAWRRRRLFVVFRVYMISHAQRPLSLSLTLTKTLICCCRDVDGVYEAHIAGIHAEHCPVDPAELRSAILRAPELRVLCLDSTVISRHAITCFGATAL